MLLTARGCLDCELDATVQLVELLASTTAGCPETLGAEEVFGVVDFHDRWEEVLVDV